MVDLRGCHKERSISKRYQCEDAVNIDVNPNIIKSYQPDEPYRGDNPYVPYRVEKTQTEEVFSCFARRQGSGNLALYFISREYIAKRPVHYHTYNSTGRFVFESSDDSREGLKAIAFVEKPVDVRRPRSDTWQTTLEAEFYNLDPSACWYI